MPRIFKNGSAAGPRWRTAAWVKAAGKMESAPRHWGRTARYNLTSHSGFYFPSPLCLTHELLTIYALISQQAGQETSLSRTGAVSQGFKRGPRSSNESGPFSRNGESGST